MDKQSRVRLIAEIGDVLDTHCKRCEVFAENQQNIGFHSASRFCVRECKIGLKLAKMSKPLQGLGDQDVPRQSNHWTKDEVFYLKGHIGRLPVEKIAQKLGKTVGAVKSKMHREGISPWKAG